MLFCSDWGPPNPILEEIYPPSHVDWWFLNVILAKPTITETIRAPLTYDRKSKPGKYWETRRVITPKLKMKGGGREGEWGRFLAF